MNSELESRLFQKYPAIFSNVGKSPQESCMAFGLEVGDGWYDLIDVMCEALTYTFTTSVRIDKEDGERLGIKPVYWGKTALKPEEQQEPMYYFGVRAPQVIADQVKEKFGSLRFYFHLEYDKENISLIETKKYPELEEINKRYASYIDGVVHFADIASARTCEVTGADGVMCVRNGWYKVLNEDLIKTERYAQATDELVLENRALKKDKERLERENAALRIDKERLLSALSDCEGYAENGECVSVANCVRAAIDAARKEETK